MLLPTHLIITTAIAKGLDLSGIDLFYAYLFGVGIDLDHLLYIKRIKEKDFWLSKGDKNSDHTWIHEPIGLIFMIVITILLKSWIPIIFYLIHFILDQLIARALKKPLTPFSNKQYMYGLIQSGSKIEWILAPFLLILSLIMIWVFWY